MFRHRSVPWAAGLALALATVTPFVRAEGSGTVAEAVTLEKVWYSTDRKGAPGKRFNLKGDLKLTDQALEFDSGKRKVRIALDTIHVLSLGKMKGDVDTDWAVLAVGRAAPWQLVGIRDGRKLGYGEGTREIHAALREGLRRARAGQYAVPQGYATYDAIDTQVTLAVPEGWSAHLESLVFVGQRAPWGTIVFSEQPLAATDATDGGEAQSTDLARALNGEVPAFWLERREIGKGMSPRGFTDRVRQELVAEVTGDPLFAGGAETLQTRPAESATIDGCAGLRIQARGRRADGVEALLELRAVVHGDTLYLFGLRARTDRYDRHVEPFEAALASVRFSVAR